MMGRDIVSARSTQLDSEKAAAELSKSFDGLEAKAIVFFCSHKHDGMKISAALRRTYPKAEVIGCTTAGEFTNDAHGVESVSAVALGGAKVKRCVAGIAKFEGGVRAGLDKVATYFSNTLKADLRQLDAKRYVGIVLFEGLKGKEEDANDVLGDIAPQL
jgi:hypothetical protein